MYLSLYYMGVVQKTTGLTLDICGKQRLSLKPEQWESDLYSDLKSLK